MILPFYLFLLSSLSSPQQYQRHYDHNHNDHPHYDDDHHHDDDANDDNADHDDDANNDNANHDNDADHTNHDLGKHDDFAKHDDNDDDDTNNDQVWCSLVVSSVPSLLALLAVEEENLITKVNIEEVGLQSNSSQVPQLTLPQLGNSITFHTLGCGIQL